MSAGNDNTPTSTARPRGPLSGVKVIDLTSVLMGPYATQILADYGADVIRVEPPEGDVMRKAGPMRSPGMGPLHLQVNRNKRSVMLDLKEPRAREAVLKLCADADVLVHNIRTAAIRRLGLTEADVRAVNPRLIYVSLVGYGENGPYAGRPAYDDLMQGICGLPSIAMQAGATEPRYVPLTMVDHIVGLNAVHVVLAALLHRDRTGEVQTIELPMFETMSQFVLSDHLCGRSYDPPTGAPGYERLMTPNRKPYQTSDGYVCVLVYNDKHWKSFYEAIGRADEFARDPRLNNLAVRAKHYDEVYGMLADIFRTRTSAEWMALLDELDIPCVPMNSLDELIDDPHLAAVGFFAEREHPTEGRLRYVGVPSRWRDMPLGVYRDAPHLGEHTAEVLREAGVAEAEIAALTAPAPAQPRARKEASGGG